MNSINGKRTKTNPLRALIWGGAACLLALPWVAMQFTSEVNWDATDFLVIGVMLLTAGMTLGSSPAKLILLGAWGFACSDLAVARRQFVVASPFNGLWGTPLYFGSQMLLAASLAFH